MVSPQRALLRLHIEAVWGLRLPPIEQDTFELLSKGPQPSWKLYVADMAAGEQVAIWRPDVAETERDVLLAYARDALTVHPSECVAPHISREVALHKAASPSISAVSAQQIAHLLTPDDQALVEEDDSLIVFKTTQVEAFCIVCAALLVL